MGTTNSATRLVRLLKSLTSSVSSKAGRSVISDALQTKGRLRRWSSRNTVPGILALAVTESVAVEGISWPAVALGFVTVLPLMISVFPQKKEELPSQPLSTCDQTVSLVSHETNISDERGT
jgi:hypothetical protein